MRPSHHQSWDRLKKAQSPFGSSSSILRLANEFLHTHSLSELLPYRSFDPETQIFFNRSSCGFVLETLPLVGCGEDIPRQLTGFFQHTLPLGSNLQCLLIGSSRIETLLETWKEAREGSSEALRDLAFERVKNFKKTSQEKGLRTFRLILSYSEPSSLLEGKQSLEDLLSLREQLITTLQGWGLPVKIWGAEDLIDSLDELLNPTLDTLCTPSRGVASSDPLSKILCAASSSWEIYETLSRQMLHPSTHVFVDPSQLVFGEGDMSLQATSTPAGANISESPKVMRLYTTRGLPSFWHQGGMGNMIGDPLMTS